MLREHKLGMLHIALQSQCGVLHQQDKRTIAVRSCKHLSRTPSRSLSLSLFLFLHSQKELMNVGTVAWR